MGAFSCNRCGACCRLAGTLPQLAAYAGPDGVCRFLIEQADGAHACAIYDERPRICRVDEMRPEVIHHGWWNRANERACSKLRLQVYGQKEVA